ncbi:response regulator [Natronomonas salina]|uniref:response regulator n=1 Tax=Natronomonas salina TaxID=1710540 RepID=UPI0015B71244|nr:response regulator [Natronomonas salina]QLD90114.1 response regulator [Natronomonas salina]
MASDDGHDPAVGAGGGPDVPGGAPVEVTTPEELTILFVDDERQLLSIVASRLKEEMGPLEVVTASHGTDALERLDQLAVDCIVSDYKMPGMDGLELLKKCRERDPDVPFILFTSKGSEDIATEAINADVTDYLQKNMGEEQFALLANRIQNAVSEYRAKQIARDTYAHVRRIHDRVSDAYLGLDDEWRIGYVDEAAADLLTDGHESLLGERFWDVLPEAVGSPFETEFERALETGEPVDFETRYEPFDTWFEVRAFPSEDGLSVYFRDVTDLKEQAETIDRQRGRLDEVADAVDDLEAVAADLDDGFDRARESCDCDDGQLGGVDDALDKLDGVVATLERVADEE